MKKFVSVLLVLLLIPQGVHAAVRITEIAWMGTIASQYSEWFELYNDSDSAVSLAGWKLVQGDGSVMFTLSKSIEANGYLLVERTTASAPDAVPGIDDESGPFGASGFANTGEDLILKDATGSAKDTLSFASGWPAGDAATKDTMQLDGTTWRTAPPTPKAPFEGGTNDTSQDGESPKEEEPVDPYPIPKVSPNKPQIAFTVPSTIYKGVPYRYEAQPLLEYNYRLNEGDLYWNMGDGTTIRQVAVAPIMHTYEYPGTYTISFSYKDFAHEYTPLIGSKVVQVKAPTVSASIIDGTAVELKNTSSTVVDLTGWSIVVAGRTILLPDMTVLAAKATATIPLKVFGIAKAQRVTLLDPSGSAVVPEQTQTIDASSVISQEISDDASVYDTEPADLVASAPSFTDDTDTSTTPIQNRTKSIIFGAVALFVIGLSILLERFMARQEYGA